MTSGNEGPDSVSPTRSEVRAHVNPPIGALCDQLDRLRAEATTQGRWVNYESGWQHVIAPEDDRWYVSRSDDLSPPDAALIVAAVNALPTLIAAIRAVEALADELDHEWGTVSGPRNPRRIGDDIRAALATVAGQ